MNDHHDTYFRAMIPAVDRRYLKAIGVGVISEGEKHYKDDHMMSKWWAEKQDIRNNNLVSRESASSDHNIDGYPMTSAPIPNYRVANGCSKSPYRNSALSPPVTGFDHAGLYSNKTY